MYVYFLRKVRYVFRKLCKIFLVLLWQSHKITWHVAFVLQDYFKVF